MKRLVALLTLALVGVVAPPAAGSSIHVDGGCRLTDKGVVLTGRAITDHATANWTYSVRLLGTRTWDRAGGYRTSEEVSDDGWIDSRFRSWPANPSRRVYRLDLTLRWWGDEPPIEYEAVAYYSAKRQENCLAAARTTR